MTRDELIIWIKGQGFIEKELDIFVKSLNTTSHRFRLSKQVFYRDVKPYNRWVPRYRGRYDQVSVDAEGMLVGVDMV